MSARPTRGSDAPTASGMIQMRERAALVGGRVQVHSGLGLGTEVRVTVPDSRTTI